MQIGVYKVKQARYKNHARKGENTMQAYYKGEEIKVHFVAESVRTDFGVPGSPVWEEVDMNTVDVDQVFILDTPVDIKELPKALQDAILSLWIEVEFY
jgi:hypothetical protein